MEATHESEPTPTPEVEAPTPAETPPPQDMTIPTYHIDLWADPRCYYCLICATTGYTLMEVTTHLDTVHSLAAVPTPLAAQPPALQPLVEEATDGRHADVSHADRA